MTAQRHPAVRRSAALRAHERQRAGLRRLAPGIALSVCLTLAAAALIVTNPIQAAVVLGLVVAALAASRMLRASWPYVRISLSIAAVVLVVNPLFGAAGLDVLWEVRLGPAHVAVTVQGIVYGLSSALRLSAVILAFALLNLCVDADDQLALISRFSFRSGLVLSLASRLLPVFSRDAQRITDAQLARGVPLDTGRWSRRAAARLPLLACMLTQSLERAVDVAASMQARGYGAGPRTSWRRRRPWSVTDRLTLGAVLVAAAALTAGIVGGVWSFTFFPLLDDPWAGLGTAAWLLVLAGLSASLLLTATWRRTRHSNV